MNTNSKNKNFYNGFKIIARYLGEYKKDLIVLSVLGVVSAVANGFVPYLVGRLFDAILDPGRIFDGTFFEMPLWLLFIIIWGVVQLTANVVDWRNDVKRGWLGEDIFAGYTIRGFSRLLELPVSFHKSNKMGEIGDKINRAASALNMVTDSVIVHLAPQFLSVFVALAIMFYINPVLASIMIAGLLVYVMILIKVVVPLAELHRKGHKEYGKAYGDSYDAIYNVQAVKQAVSEKYEQKKIFKNFKLKAMRSWFKILSIWGKLSFYQRLVIMFTQLAIFILSINFILKGTMTIGELIMFNGYAAMLFGPFVVLGRNWQTIQNGVIALERGEKILSAPTEKYNPKNAVILPDINGEVEFKNIFFAYKKGEQVLEDISFKVNPGEVIALVGESGVGKSTLIDLVSGYYFAKKGDVFVDGRNIKNLNLKFLRSKIAVVPQEVVLFNDTIKTNIKYGNFGASDEEMERAAEKANCLEFIEKFPKKWKQVVGERGIKLSVGQKQRVAIARAILRDPKILILDEPTSALDAKSESIIQKSLEELMEGRTTFIIAHRLSTVHKADKILVLDKGRIAETGTHDELIKKESGIYRELYELQFGFRN